jgi:DNA-binding transcriptional LysR family regulator
MYDFRRLRTFREVAERGSFSAAAEALNFTQPAVSQHISALEREIGASLLRRSRTGVELTEAGALLLEHAVAVLDRLSAAEVQLGELTARREKLRITGFPSAVGLLIPRAILAFLDAHPDVPVTVEEAGLETSVAGVRCGRVDVAVVFDAPDRPADMTDVERHPLFEEPMFAALPPGHRLARRRGLRLADLAEETWVVGTPDPEHGLIYRACLRAGFEPRVGFQTRDAIATRELVAAGLAVTLLPALMIAGAGSEVAARKLRDAGLVRRVAAVAHAHGRRSPATAAMLDALAATAPA